MAKGCAERHGLIYLGSELGGMGSVSPDGVRLAYEGTLRALKHLDVLRDDSAFAVPHAAPTQFMQVADRNHFVYAPAAGVFAPLLRLGDPVAQGQLFGHVHFVDEPARAPAPVHFRHGGVLICKRHPGRVERGDCLAHLATERDAA
jgi:predicted deacylase